MVLRNTTILSGEEAGKEMILPFKKYYYKKYIFSGILLLVGAITLGIVFGLGSGQDSALMGYLFLAFGTILAAINTYSIATFKRKQEKTNPDLFDTGLTNKFIFKEESFQVSTIMGSSTSKKEYAYNELGKIIEYDDKIIFKVSSLELYVCKKSGFQSSKEVEQFFYGLSKHKTKIKKKFSKKE